MKFGIFLFAIAGSMAVSMFGATFWATFWATEAWATETQEVIYQAKIEEENPTLAKKKMIEEATSKVAENLVVELIGEPKSVKYKSLLRDKVYRYSQRFIPVVKTGELQKKDKSYEMTVTVQVVRKNLEQMLSEAGVLYESEGLPVILPLIAIKDFRQNTSFRWWENEALEGTMLVGLGLELERQLQASLFQGGFFVERPEATNLRDVRSLVARGDLSPEDWQRVAPLFNASVVIGGEISVSQGSVANQVEINVKLQAVQVGSLRVVADVSRKVSVETKDFETGSKKMLKQMDVIFRDLASTMQDAWARGTFTANSIRLTILGGLPLPQYEKFKEAVLAKSRSIRQIRERTLANDQISFDIDVTKPAMEIAKELQGLALDPMKFLWVASSSSATQIVFQRKNLD